LGSFLTKHRKVDDLIESQVTPNGRKFSRAKASRPSVNATLVERRTVANVQPRATVKTRSKAFI
jgi:hypothetical protein